MPLDIDYRPKNFDMISGNAPIVSALKAMLLDIENMPHAFLFKGRPGCGKTTFAFTLKHHLGISEEDWHIYDTANQRGIDVIRDMVNGLKNAPLNGERKLYLLDECFSADTQIKTLTGFKPINSIKKGVFVFNINGKAKVKNTFLNKIPLDRVISVNLTNGKKIFTTKQHEFLTDGGWIEAQYLKDLTLYIPRDNVLNIKSQRRAKDGNKNMQMVWKAIFSEISSFRLQAMLQHVLCLQAPQSVPFIPKESLYQREKQSLIGDTQTIIKYKKVQRTGTSFLREDEEEQPNAYGRSYRKSIKRKTDKRNSPYMVREKGREWSIYSTPIIISLFTRMANGISNFIGKETARISNLLQSRFGHTQTENSNRGRWGDAQTEKDFIKRCKEDKKTERIRVESIEVYKRGNNDESFKSIIADKERDQGFVSFYDLEIEGHSSYIAEGVPVHNCHQITPEGLNALLRTLEYGCPDHCFIVLCTAEFDSIKAILRDALSRRCRTYEVMPINIREMNELLSKIINIEGYDVKDYQNIIDKIVSLADGSPGHALGMLDSVINMSDEDEIIQALEFSAYGSKAVMDICRILSDPQQSHKWGKIKKIIPSIKKNDVESLRYGMLNWLEKVLLDKSSEDIVDVMTLLTETFMYTGRAGLTIACYLACKQLEGVKTKTKHKPPDSIGPFGGTDDDIPF